MRQKSIRIRAPRPNGYFEYLEGDPSSTATNVIVDDELWEFTGILDHEGNELYRIPEKVTIGFKA